MGCFCFNVLFFAANVLFSVPNVLFFAFRWQEQYPKICIFGKMEYPKICIICNFEYPKICISIDLREKLWYNKARKRGDFLVKT